MRLALFLIFSLPAWCIPNVSVSSSAAAIGNVTTFVPFSHTCAVGDNSSLTVGITGMMGNAGGPFSVTSVTWSTTNGPTINLIKNTTNFDFAGLIADETWHMFVCPSGLTGNITATWTTPGACNCVSMRALAVSVSNSNFVNPVVSFIGATTGSINPSTTTSFTVNVAANDVLMAVANGGSTNTFTSFACSGGTPVEDFNHLDDNNVNAGGHCGPLSAGNHTIGWTSNTADYRGMIVVDIRQFSSYPVVSGSLTKTFAIPSITETSLTSIDSGMGDTNLCSASNTLPALASGSINGGVAFCTANDGVGTASGLCPASYAVCLFKLTAYAAGVPTFAAGIDMTGYGPFTNPGSTTCAGRSGWNNKNRSPVVYKGRLYTYIGCPNDAFSDWAQEGVLAFASDLAHACNWATWQANSNSCPTSGTSTTGDAPTSDAGYQWPNHSGSLTTWAAMQVIATGAQGDPCFHNPPAGMDKEFVYLYTTQGITRFPCSAASPMDPTTYTVRKSDGTWSATASDMASVTWGLYNLNSMTWDRYHGLFIATGDVGHGWATAPLPWGTWAPQNPVTNTAFAFTGLLDSVLTVAAGRVASAITLNTQSTSHNFQFEVVDLGPTNAVWGSAQ
jgi:hypothetical protein